MIDGFKKLLRGLSSVDAGIECVLNNEALDGLVEITRSAYGETAAQVVHDAFRERRSGTMVCVVEDLADAFADCLTGPT